LNDCFFCQTVHGAVSQKLKAARLYRQRAPITAREGYANSIQQIVADTSKGD
jgi:hypothetical protein